MPQPPHHQTSKQMGTVSVQVETSHSHLIKIIRCHVKKYSMRNSSLTHQSCSRQDRAANLAPYSDDDKLKPLLQIHRAISRSYMLCIFDIFWLMIIICCMSMSWQALWDCWKETLPTSVVWQFSVHHTLAGGWFEQTTCRVHVTTLNTQTTTLWSAS